MDILLEKNMIYFFETDKDYSKQTCGKKSRKQLVDRIIRQIKARINRNIRQIFESEEDYYQPVRAGNIWNNNYTRYESNGNKNKGYQSKNTLMKLNYT